MINLHFTVYLDILMSQNLVHYCYTNHPSFPSPFADHEYVPLDQKEETLCQALRSSVLEDNSDDLRCFNMFQFGLLRKL